jgi:NAD-dependent SIR2 family protein deacetylase
MTAAGQSDRQDRISELHGNSNREHCKDCGKEFIRGTHPV